MEIFVPDSAIAPLEAAIAPARGKKRLAVLATLAWHLRQRDTRRAEVLALEGFAVLDAVAPEDDAARARLTITRAECAFFLARMADASTLCAEAAQLFRALQDHAGQGDCAWMDARIAEGRGARD